MKRLFTDKPVKILTTLICAFVTLIAFMPALAYSWGSLAPAKTHQYICQEAYKKLSADPAFDPKKFPTVEEILNNEGVTWVRYQWTGAGYIGLGVDYGVLNGNGPDSKGSSKFSEHYYNPKIGSDNKGGAPAAVAKYYKYLAEGGSTGKKEPLPKAAAWGAHFLADMFCPYHINGADRATTKAIYDAENVKHAGTIDLGDDVKGIVKLGYLQPVKFISDNFNTEVARFLNKSEEDWFDPWYYNGDTEYAMSETSSHIAWEVTINPAGDIPSGYNTDWKNAPAQNFAVPWTAQSEQAKLFAIAAATETSEKIDVYFDKPEPAVNKAIQAVATLWRASITAIYPTIEYTQPAEYILVKGKIVNRGNVNLTDTEIKLTASGCSLASWNDSQKLGTIPAGGNKMTDEIKVHPGNLSCHLKLQVTAVSAMPDLQYAQTETTVTPKAKEKPKTGDSPEPEATKKPAATDGKTTLFSIDNHVVKPGQIVTYTGIGFGLQCKGCYVFCATECSTCPETKVISWSDTEIIFQVPPDWHGRDGQGSCDIRIPPYNALIYPNPPKQYTKWMCFYTNPASYDFCKSYEKVLKSRDE